MKKEQQSVPVSEALNENGKTTPIALGDTVRQECPFCGPDSLFRVAPGFRAVCEKCGYEIHMR
jgi:uncharacterized protein (DUF983 family)